MADSRLAEEPDPAARDLPGAALRRFEIVDDGGTLIRLDGCRTVDAVADAIRWLDAAGVRVHRVVELPTDPGSAAHGLADTINLERGGPVAAGEGRGGAA